MKHEFTFTSPNGRQYTFTRSNRARDYSWLCPDLSVGFKESDDGSLWVTKQPGSFRLKFNDQNLAALSCLHAHTVALNKAIAFVKKWHPDIIDAKKWGK